MYKSKNKKLAVLITCYNRRNTTMSCLATLAKQNIPCDIHLDIYLVDDGSSDGTTEAVSQNYPEVKILPGDGNLFWAGGMRLAFAQALEHQYNYYLWLNDDTFLEPQAVSNLINTYQKLMQANYPLSIVVGSVKDPATGKLSYGGRVRSKRLFSRTFTFVEPDQEPKPCDTMQGNVVLIPLKVAQIVGNIDPVFIHSMGDLDYGLRASTLGCVVWVAPGYYGTCSKNSMRGSWADTKNPLHIRLQKVLQKKAFPIKPWTVFIRRHSGVFWFIYWFFPYLRAIIGYRNLSVSSFKENIE